MEDRTILKIISEIKLPLAGNNGKKEWKMKKDPSWIWQWQISATLYPCRAPILSVNNWTQVWLKLHLNLIKILSLVLLKSWNFFVKSLFENFVFWILTLFFPLKCTIVSENLIFVYFETNQEALFRLALWNSQWTVILYQCLRIWRAL